jgi:enterochelin esterase family protein
VRLRHWVYGLAATPTFTRLDGTDLWYVVLDVPATRASNTRSRSSAAITSSRSRTRSTPHTARDPFGANSVLQTDGYARPAWTLPDPEARSGTLVAHRSHSAALGREVDLNLYLPARFRPTSRYPLLIVHDGNDYSSTARCRSCSTTSSPPRAGRDRGRLQQPAGPAGRVRRP